MEKIAEAKNAYKNRALTQIVERVELPEKSEILRVHLSIPSLHSDEVKAAFHANEIASDRTFGNKTPPITGVKGGHTGVPTAFGPYFCFVSLAENLPEDRMNPRHLAAQAIAANPLITYRNSPSATKKKHPHTADNWDILLLYTH